MNQRVLKLDFTNSSKDLELLFRKKFKNCRIEIRFNELDQEAQPQFLGSCTRNELYSVSVKFE